MVNLLQYNTWNQFSVQDTFNLGYADFFQAYFFSAMCKIVDGSILLHFNRTLINHVAIIRLKRQTVRKKADVERVLSAASEGHSAETTHFVFWLWCLWLSLTCTDGKINSITVMELLQSLFSFKNKMSRWMWSCVLVQHPFLYICFKDIGVVSVLSSSPQQENE